MLFLSIAALAVGVAILAGRGIRSSSNACVRAPSVRNAATSPQTRPGVRASQQNWRRQWAFVAGASLAGAPSSLADGWVVTTDQGRIAAIGADGRERWSVQFTNGAFTGSAAVAGPTVVALRKNGDVVGLDASTGHSLWQVSVEGAYRQGPFAFQVGTDWRVAFLSSADGAIRCLDAGNGRDVWQAEPTNRTDGSPACADGLIAFGNCDSAVHLISATNGQHLAAVPVGTDAQMAGGALLRGGYVYGGTRSGDLVCVGVATQDVVWRAQIQEREAFRTPVAARDAVVMGADDGTIAAFDAVRGSERWRVSMSNAVSALCPVDDAVFAVAGGRLIGLRVSDGGAFFIQSIGDHVEGPVCNGRTLVVADDGGTVIALAGE